MIEVIAFVAFALALVAFLNGRKTAERIDLEIETLKEELKRLEARGDTPKAALDGAPVIPSTEASAGGSAAPASEETSDLGRADACACTRFRCAARRGNFGGDTPPLSQEAVEKASRGEPVPARAAATGSIDSVAVHPKESLESRLGARWAVWVGGIALALGGIFMVKYSIDAGLLSPAVRLVMAALFGLVLMAGGEFVRRRAVPLIADQFQNAMIPGILTAAGALTLFGVCYAAHGIYGFIGPAAAFVLLGVVALATVALSLLHGQALAGLGLLGSLATPALVSSESPSPWALFGFLIIAWLATLLAARIRRWTVVPSIANIGLGLWAVLYIASASPFETLPVTLTMLVMIAGIGLVWPGGIQELAVADDKTDVVDATQTLQPGPWERLFVPPCAAITVTAAASAVVTALSMISPAFLPSGYPVTQFAVIVAALAIFGAWRSIAVYPAVLSATAGITGLWSMTALSGLLTFLDPSIPGAVPIVAVSGRTAMLTGMALSGFFILLAALALYRHLKSQPQFSTVWTVIASVVPLALTSMSFLMTGNLSFDAPHGLFALGTGVALLVLAEWIWRVGKTSGESMEETGHLPQSILIAGSLALFVLALHALTDGLATTLGIIFVGAAYVAATRLRAWPALPWMMVGAAIAVLARIGWEPTIVGAENLSTTPVFNALLAGYGIPAMLLVACAFELRNWPGVRVRNLLQALASLFVLLTIAILVRHAMNGGVLDSSVPTLGEQSIYTLLAIGASGILMTLDTKSPSPVFRYGGMGIGLLSMLSILFAHLIGLNPYFSGELLGSVPVFDLLLIGYLVPGLGYAGLAWYARGKRPMPYVTALAVAGAVLAFAWATLSVRRFWQGQNIADWKGFLEGETYTYSVVWLLLGVLLLVLGSRFNAKSIRIASAVLVFIAVLKVFLIDMANLEGFLRALSFIGLGGVLIGIGLFYQKILSGRGVASETSPPVDPTADLSALDSNAKPGETA
ncbi:DUF2339 domain-containing protein [Rhizobium sp. 32-5/1]|uniref:DUF2339 domain-containing protein n=1 Tax=Rhizobium sp. 32-5/1 TaxID=3019602 RepID=UPI00240DE3C4|nr:DUF2339 domain-containing protein [Rhizobium sp. 32-5/1]WEZ83933.1 DUF2339 domain-containing protein [Rhizobium sp. 32-5/1]